MAYGSRCAAEARRARRSSRAVGRQQADCDPLRGERRFSRACREASCRADLARGRCPGLGEKLTTTSAGTAPQGLQADLRAGDRLKDRDSAPSTGAQLPRTSRERPCSRRIRRRCNPENENHTRIGGSGHASAWIRDLAHLVWSHTTASPVTPSAANQSVT